ncbi:zinc-binding dehydrogenase [Streptomyces sp. 4N509B]|uniref:zinc-binding dehydrogenase n=1 Tax=Streptomyces sp. 4N509B TaxID=3457413 RepID=UPI003FD4F443
MHAVRLHAFGPPENLRHEEVPDPEPGPGQVRIAVAAAGVHLVDTALREGVAGGPWPLPELPTIPGREVAGAVDALGEGVDASWLGRRVVAHLGQAPGGYAERAVTGVERLHALPDGLSPDHAVAMVGTGRTVMGVLRFADLTAADTVLVLAAAGGIGSLLTQYARHVGARVVGAAGGPAKTAAVADLGADLAVDYTRGDWAEVVRRRLGERPATYLFEGVGGELARTGLRLLAPGGVHLAYGWAAEGVRPPRNGGGAGNSGGAGNGGAGKAVDLVARLPEAEAAERGVTTRTVLGPALFERIGGIENLRTLEEESLAHAAAGTLTPLVHHFPLAEAARAHRALAERATIGKVVLIP